MEKSVRARPRQRGKADPRVVPPLTPTGPILRTVADEEEQTTARQTLHEGVQDGLSLGGLWSLAGTAREKEMPDTNEMPVLRSSRR